MAVQLAPASLGCRRLYFQELAILVHIIEIGPDRLADYARVAITVEVKSTLQVKLVNGSPGRDTSAPGPGGEALCQGL